MCIISRLNLSNFKLQPPDFFVLLPDRLKSCPVWFPASIIFQLMFPHPFSSYPWAVPLPYLEINYMHITQIYIHLILKSSTALQNQALQVQMWFRWGWRWDSWQNPGGQQALASKRPGFIQAFKIGNINLWVGKFSAQIIKFCPLKNHLSFTWRR